MTSERVWGWLLIVIAVGVVAIAVGWWPVPPASVHAPPWVLMLVAAVFGFGGAAIILRGHKVLAAACGTAIVACFALLALWIALFGSAEHFSGGLPFVSHANNVRIGRGVFGLSGLLCAGIMWLGVRDVLRLSRAPKDGPK